MACVKGTFPAEFRQAMVYNGVGVPCRTGEENGPLTNDLTQTTTKVLKELESGDRSAAERLFPLVYDELRALAASYMRHERADHTLQPTALVHEAFLKLIEQTNVDWKNRAHFFAVAAQAIRRILIDHARRHNAQKRGGEFQRVTLEDAAPAGVGRTLDLVALDDALTRLNTMNERQARIVELRFFGGLTGEEVAHVLGLSRTTIADEWAIARAWLLKELGGTLS
jgi:RNA polymerase sigma-70 factor, ECF subfamily